MTPGRTSFFLAAFRLLSLSLSLALPAASLFCPAPSSAQKAQAEPDARHALRARIVRHPNGTVLYGEAMRVRDGQLDMKASHGTVSIPAESIASIEFELPEDVALASEAYRAGRIEQAAKLYGFLRPFASLTGLPGSNIGVEFLNWADCYRQLRKFDEAEKILREIDVSANPDAVARILLIRAFILCDRNQHEEAEKIMEDFAPTDRGDLNFPLDRIVRTRIHLSRGQLHDAALCIGESIASTRIESPIYPELLYLAAACYEKMGEAAAAKAKGQAVDQADLLMGQDVDYKALVEGVRQELSFIFPESYWAKSKPASVEKLLSGAEEVSLAEDAPAHGASAEPPEAGAQTASPWLKFLKKDKPEDPEPKKP